MTFVKTALAGAICLSLLSGCAMTKKTEKEVDDDRLNVEQLKQRMSDGAASSSVLAIARSKLAGEEIVLKDEASLPAMFSRNVMYTTGGQRLDEVLASLSRQIGMPVWLTEFATDGAAFSDGRSDGGLGATEIQLQWSGPLSGLLDQVAQSARLHWRFNEGRVEFFLYETRHYYVNLPMGARTMSAQITGKGGGSGSVGNPNTSNGSGTGDISISTGNMSIDPYNALTRTITAMLMEDDGNAEIIGNSGYSNNQGAGGSVSVNDARTSSTTSGYGNRRGNRSRVVVTPEMAMITVTAPPTSLDRVSDYIERVNQRFSKNVMIDVKIYDVSLNENAGVGFSADMLYTKLGSYGVQVAGGSVGVLGATPQDLATIAARETAKIAAANAVAAAAGTTVTNTVIDPVTGATHVVTTTTAPAVAPQAPYVADAPSRFSGSAALARALESFGKISSITSGQVMAVNGQPAPLQIATEVTYLASTTTTSGNRATVDPVTGDSSNISSSLTPGSVVVGLTANFLPQVLGDNRILLQYQLTSSSLAGMTTVSSGGSSIQTPTVSSQSLQQQAFVRDGEAIVLFGLEQNASSVTGERAIPATYGRDASKSRTLRVIMLQVFGGGTNANNS